MTRIDPARMAAMSWPDQNRHFNRRWLDPLDPPQAPAGGRVSIRWCTDPSVLRPVTRPNLGLWPRSEAQA
jgi:hypothetical protein